MYQIHIVKTNGQEMSYPKVTKFSMSKTKLGQRFTFNQVNGVKIDIAVDVIKDLEIKRKEGSA